MGRFLFWGLLSAAAFAQTVPSAPNTDSARISTAIPVPHFEDIAPQAGWTVSHISSPAARYIIESVSGGCRLSACCNNGTHAMNTFTCSHAHTDPHPARGP